MQCVCVHRWLLRRSLFFIVHHDMYVSVCRHDYVHLCLTLSLTRYNLCSFLSSENPIRFDRRAIQRHPNHIILCMEKESEKSFELFTIIIIILILIIIIIILASHRQPWIVWSTPCPPDGKPSLQLEGVVHVIDSENVFHCALRLFTAEWKITVVTLTSQSVINFVS